MSSRRKKRRPRDAPPRAATTEARYLRTAQRAADSLLRIIDRDLFRRQVVMVNPAWPDWAWITAAGLAQIRNLLEAMVGASKKRGCEPAVQIMGRTVCETFILAAYVALYEDAGHEKLARAHHAQSNKTRRLLGQEPEPWEPREGWSDVEPTWENRADRLNTTALCDQAIARAKRRPDAQSLTNALEGARIGFQAESELGTHALFSLLRSHRATLPAGTPLGGAVLREGGTLPADFSLPAPARLITTETAAKHPSLVAWRLHYARDFTWWLAWLMSFGFELNRAELDDLLNEATGGLNLVHYRSEWVQRITHPDQPTDGKAASGDVA